MYFNMSGKLKRLMLSLLFSLLIVFVLVGIISLVLPYLSSADRICGYVRMFLRFAFCFLCAFFFSKGASSRGFLSGGAVGLILFILSVFTLILNGETLGTLAIIKELALYLICGAAGGIVGINI